MKKIMFSNISVIGVTILLFLIVTITSSAQTNESDRYSPGISMRIGGGLTGGSDYSGFGGLIGVQRSSQIGLIGIRYLISGRATVDPMTLTDNRLQESNEISITYGIEKRYSMIYMSGSAGLGTMWGNEQIVGGNNNFNVAVIPIELQLSARFSRIIRVGGMLSTSINTKKTLTNLMMVLHIGSIN
jgi:hypothetical protein